MKRWFPLGLTIILALWIAGSIRVPTDKPGTFAVNEFGRLPVVSNGRFQPLDSFARNSLLQLREKQSANLEPWKSWYQKPKLITATQWLLEMTMNQAVADTYPVIRIDNPDLKGLLALPMDADPAKMTDGKHFSWLQIQPKLKELQEEYGRAASKEQSQRNPFERAVMHTMDCVGLYMKIQNTLAPQNARDWQQELNSYFSSIAPGVAAARAQQAGKTDYDKAALDRLMSDLQRFDVMTRLEAPLVVPGPESDAQGHGWVRMGDALMNIARGGEPHFAIAAYARMVDAYKAGDTSSFNAAVGEYRGRLAGEFGPQLKKAGSEQVFNFFEPFYKGMIIFVLAGLLAIGFWFAPVEGEWLRRTAVWLCVLGLVVHTSGLIYRMVLEGRPPVTNLYSSAIFIGWGTAVLGLILEAFWKNSIGAVITSVCAFLSLIIAHHLSLSGDTMEMMRAVLDTNFWLATHVVVVTLGYASTFVAGFLAIMYIVRGFFTSGLDNASAKSLAKMVYGIVCFATLFSFVGTVLGGIWADQSWGRFWGWDAKENGALMIVIWNATILHARWGGLVRERGLMGCAIFGNIVTSWSWFGVNMLGIGLHSYGFMDQAFKWLLLFVGLCLMLITVSMFPNSVWRSFATSAANRGIRQALGAVCLVLAIAHIIEVMTDKTNGRIVFYIELALWIVVTLVSLALWIIRLLVARSEVRTKSEQAA